MNALYKALVGSSANYYMHFWPFIARKKNNLNSNRCKRGQERCLSKQTAESARGNIKEVALFSLEK